MRAPDSLSCRPARRGEGRRLPVLSQIDERPRSENMRAWRAVLCCPTCFPPCRRRCRLTHAASFSLLCRKGLINLQECWLRFILAQPSACRWDNHSWQGAAQSPWDAWSRMWCPQFK